MSIFTEIQLKKPNSNTFDLSHDKKMSLKMGQLVPMHCQEIIPGDKINMSTSHMLRLAPMISPVMHRVNIYTHFFFVPNRIIWDNWESFITGGEDGEDASVFPTMEIDGEAIGSINDYMGIPQKDGPVLTVSALPSYAYLKIYNEYYRDQNLIDKFVDKAIDGDNSAVDIRDGVTLQEFLQEDPLQRAWSHDYFTSALPWTQKGAEATIPIASMDRIEFKDENLEFPVPLTTNGVNALGDVPTDGEFGFLTALSETDGRQPIQLTSATQTSINDLRRAFKLQEWLEKNARGGSRYVESILSHFGVRSSDARLQRPEFLGGGSAPVTISEVLQTSSMDETYQNTPQGNMAGHGISVGANNSFSYRAEEHGYIIGIMSIMPKSAYQDGIPKHLLKFDKFDYFWPSFAHIGEQAIQNQELYVDDDGENEETFGYTPRYAEYKFINSSVHGEFRTSLDFWHMGRKFVNRPYLNEEFINCDPTTRIFAVLDSETVYCHLFHRIKAKRLMPYFATPKL